MKTVRLLVHSLIAGSIATSLFAAPAPPETGLAIVPPDSLAVAQVRLDQLRASDLAPSLFHEADQITVDGKAAAFLKDSGLDPKRDIDGAVFSLSAGQTGSEEPRPLVAFEGRFDPAALSAATISRGAIRVDSGPVPYVRMPASAIHDGKSGETGAVAFLSSHVILAGSEPALVHALELYNGGHAGLPSKGTLAGMIARIDPKASAWVVLDAGRVRQLKEASHAHESGDGPASAVYSALRSVSWILFQANLSSGGVDVKATGLSSDEEARQNIEDVLRGMIAGWRMAVQSKSPELVSALRKFTISRDAEGVTIAGRLPAELLKSAKR